MIQSSRTTPVIPGAVIVAAGYSSRMGRFKPLLPLNGATTIECAIGAFRQVGVRDIIVVVGHNADRLVPLLDRLEVSWTLNPDYPSGMFSSIATGVAALPVTLSGFFLLPVDIALVRPRTVARMIEHAASAEASVRYPTYRGKRGHPPLISSELFSEILTGDRKASLRDILRRHEADALDVPVCDRGILLDMDTPADYDVLAERARHQDIPDEDECLALLESQPVPERVLRHVRAVAGIADHLVRGLNERGMALDGPLARAGALLHDLAKGTPDHAAVGARIVEDAGFPAVARIVAGHDDLDFASGTLDEEALVYLADKLVREDRLVSIAERFSAGMARFPEGSEAWQGAARRWATAEKVAAAAESHLGMPLSRYLEAKGDTP